MQETDTGNTTRNPKKDILSGHGVVKNTLYFTAVYFIAFLFTTNFTFLLSFHTFLLSFHTFLQIVALDISEGWSSHYAIT